MWLWPFLVSLHTRSLSTTTTTHSFPRGWTLAAPLTLDGFLLDRDTCIVPSYRRMDYIQVAYLKSQTISTSWEEFQGVLHNFPDTQASFRAAPRLLGSSLWLLCYRRHICFLPSSLRAQLLKSHHVKAHFEASALVPNVLLFPVPCLMVFPPSSLGND